MLLKEDNFNTYSQIEALKQGRSPVGGDCYHTIFHSIFIIEFQSLFITVIGAMSIAPYGFFNSKLLSSKNNKITLYRTQP